MLTLLADELRASDNPPQNRAQLFDRFVDRYLSEWARVKGAGAVRVEKEILSALAWRLGTNRTLLSADEAAAAMSARLAELQNKKEASPDLNVASLNREFLEHGLLRESAGQTGFFHQAVQEYFFAREVALHQSTEYVLKHVGDPDWAEVLVFVCGLIEDATDVVQEMMKVEPISAVKCTTYAKRINENVIEELAQILIGNLQQKFEKDIWFGKFYQEMLAILVLEPLIHIEKLAEIFCRVYKPKSQALHYLVRLLLWMKIPEKAIPFLEDLIKENENDVRSRGYLARALRLTGNIKDAMMHLEKCMEVKPDDGWNWGELGLLYKNMNNLDKAEYCLRRSVDLANKLLWAHYNLALTLKEKKNYDGALEEFQKAIELDPDYPWTYIGRADMYYENFNEAEKAIIEYETAIQLEQRPFLLSLARFRIARVIEAAGMITKALQRYQEYLDRDPWGEHAPEALVALERLGTA